MAALFVIAENWKLPLGYWRNKYIRTMEYHAALRKNEVELYVQ